jgi:UDP-2-acetamido-3-amino-2,3-dideoxy-glucuronate N-acetyltransferase
MARSDLQGRAIGAATSEARLRPSSVFVDPMARVDDDVVLGDGTRIRQFASLTRGVVMGEDCSVSPFAMLDGSIYGDRVVISAGYAAGAGFKVGSDVFIGPNVTLCNDMWPGADKRGYDAEALRKRDRFAVIVEDGVTLGAGCIVLPGVRIGEGAIIAAGAVVDHDVPASMVFRLNGYTGLRPDDWRERRMRWAK